MSDSEILDIVNEDDEVLGQATKAECHKDPNLMHRTVHFTLIDPHSKKLLLTQRGFGKENDPGKYCFLGEHILAGEDYVEALHRGAQEELRIEFEKFEEIGKNIFRFDTQTELVKFYLIEFSEGLDLDFDKNEIEKIMWLSKEELLESDLDISEMNRHWMKFI